MGEYRSNRRVHTGLSSSPPMMGSTYSRPSTTVIATADSRTAAARPMLSRAISPKYSTVPAAARTTGACARVTGRKPCAAVKPFSGVRNWPASSEPSTATAAVARTAPVSTAAFAASSTVRRGTAASVVRIIPELYSPVSTITASTAIAAWPSMTPVRLFLTGSAPQVLLPHWTTDAVIALPATVMTTAVASSQGVLGTVRSFVHSARRASPNPARRPPVTAGRPAGPAVASATAGPAS